MAEILPPSFETNIGSKKFSGRQFDQSQRSSLLLPSRRIEIPGHPDMEKQLMDRLAEEVLNTDEVSILAGRGNPKLARDIGKILSFDIDMQPINIFYDGESHVRIKDNAREKEVFIIQTIARADEANVNDNMIDLLLMIGAAKKASAGMIRVVLPYSGYGRGDKRNQAREPVPAAEFFQLMVAAGANSILTIDMHSGASEGAVPEPIDSLFGSAVLIPAIQKMGIDIDKAIVVSPDAGGLKRAVHYSNLLGIERDAQFMPKMRPEDNKTTLLKDFEGKYNGLDVIIVDDIADTCGTLIGAAEAAKARGAKRVIVAVTHGLFSTDKDGTASDKIMNSPIDKVITTDTIVQTNEIKNNPKIEIVTVASLLARALKRVHFGKPVSGLIPDPKHPENKDWMCS